MPYQITTYQDTSYQDTSYQDTTGTGGGGTTPYDQDPPFGPPLLWEAVLADLSVFFDELGGPVVEHGNDQNSYYDDPADSAPLGELFLESFGWMPHVQDMAGAHYFDYLTSDIDPEFMLTAYGAHDFVANFSRGQVSVQQLSNGTTFAMTLNGITVFGTWHSGAPTTTIGDAIVVTGGHWTFDYTGFDAGYYGGNPPPPSPPQIAAPSADVAAAVANPEGVAEDHRQALSTKLHALLNEGGGHVTITFKGPNGNETFDLEDLVNILDHYHVVATDKDYRAITGGAGQVHPDGHGGWVTEVNRAQLVGYEIAAYNQLDFFILHEVGHMLSNSLAYTHSQYDGWLAGGGTRETFVGTNGSNDSAALWRSESYSNNIAAAVEHRLGMEPPQHPPGGYDYAGFHG